MKSLKTLVLLAFLFLTIQPVRACHLDTLGWCSGKAYYITKQFNNNGIFEFRMHNTTSLLFTYITKPTGLTDTIISVDQSSQASTVIVEFRWKMVGSNDSTFSDWLRYRSGTNQYAGCSFLATTFTYVNAQRDNNKLNVSFNNENEEGVSSYNVQLSIDGVRWDNVKNINATGAHTYSYSFTLIAKAVLLFPLLLISFKRRTSVMILGLVILAILPFACKKASIVNTTDKEYKYVRIEAITQDGSIHSIIKTF